MRTASRLLRELRADRRLRRTAVVATLTVALVVAIPAVIIPNPFFQRMVPLQWWAVAVWAAAAPLGGLAVALARRPACPVGGEGRAAAGGAATLLAVTCPVCNALVVAAVGASGALTYFAPLQPLLGVAGLALLVGVLRRQARRLPADQPAPAARR